MNVQLGLLGLLGFVSFVCICICLCCCCLYRDKIISELKLDKLIENFDQKTSAFATNIVNEFKNNNLSYVDYLNLLIKYNNTSLNLISKSSYNKIISNNNLTPNDILSII